MLKISEGAAGGEKRMDRMKKKVACLFAFLFVMIIGANAFAENTSRVVEVMGEGRTRKLAIIDGLKQALLQVEGVSFNSVEVLQTKLDELSTVDNGQEADHFKFNEKQDQEIISRTNGYIRSYEILSAEKSSEGFGWEVMLSVTLPEYKTPGESPDTRRKLAVMPFRVSEAYCVLDGEDISCEGVAKDIGKELVRELTQTRKFAVLDRDYAEEVLAEREIILSPDAAVEEQAKIGEMLGADYLVVGSLAKAFLQNSRQVLEITGQSRLVSSGVFSIEYRIIVMPTRQIKWADVVTVPVENIVFGPNETDSGSRMERVCALAADQIANRIMENIYPIRIAGVQPDGQFILNQGGSSFELGQLIDVYALGDVLTDVGYTGESLGRSETWIAKLQIVRVTPKTAYAALMQGSVDGVDCKKAICRRLADAVSALPLSTVEGTRASEVEVQPEGGVKMPFDR